MVDPPKDIALADTLGAASADTRPLSDSKIARIAEADAELTSKRRLRHFEVETLIGQGGMGFVYRARDVSLDRTVALKVLPPDLTQNPELLERFRREARSQAAVSHPNVVPIYYVGEEDGLHFFAMEYVEGQSLDEILRDSGTLDWATAVEFMIRVSDALREAHSRGLIHRDLKPGNLLESSNGRIKVADFGLARPIESDDESDLTARGTFLGTPLYVAPEQARGEKIDHRADMYALGATFYHLMAGRPVFEGPTSTAIVIKHASEKPPDIRDFADVPNSFATLIGRLLAKPPVERFDDYDELIQALEDCRPQRQTHAGFWPRTFANALDAALLIPFSAMTSSAPDLHVMVEDYAGVGFLLYVFIGWAIWGKTLGKWLMKIRVVDRSYQKLNWKRALGRLAAALWGPLLLSVVLLAMFVIENTFHINISQAAESNSPTLVAFAILIGGILALWLASYAFCAVHPRKRALHDIFAKTHVIYDRST